MVMVMVMVMVIVMVMVMRMYWNWNWNDLLGFSHDIHIERKRKSQRKIENESHPKGLLSCSNAAVTMTMTMITMM